MMKSVGLIGVNRGMPAQTTEGSWDDRVWLCFLQASERELVDSIPHEEQFPRFDGLLGIILKMGNSRFSKKRHALGLCGVTRGTMRCTFSLA